MRDYGKVHSAFWTSDDARALSEDGRALALYLMTCPHGNMLGCFRLPNAYASDDMQWGSERVSEAFAELYRKGFAYRCERSHWVVIFKHLKWNKLDNPNMGKSAAKLYESITPPSAARKMLCQAIKEHGKHYPAELLPGLDAVIIEENDPIETATAGAGNPIETVSRNPIETVSIPSKTENETVSKSIAVAVAVKETTLSGRPDAVEVLDYLNQKAGRAYRPLDVNLRLIKGRLAESSLSECKAVIDAKVAEWARDPKMAQYLRPNTLFNATNYAQYVGQLGPASGVAGHAGDAGMHSPPVDARFRGAK